MNKTNKFVEEKIKSSFDNAVPNVLSGILSSCKEEGSVISMYKEKKNIVKIFSVAAAAAAVMVIGVFTFMYYSNNMAVASVVGLDVNPSINMNFSASERVLDATANNEDGKKILDGMNLKGTDADVAMYAIIGSMLKNGYIDEISNAVLVSVDNKDKAKGEELESKLSTMIYDILKDNKVEGSVLGQTIKDEDKDLQQIADENSISVGKAKLIHEIIAMDSKYTFEALSKMSVKELSILAEKKVATKNLVGKPNSTEYIGEEKALATAVAHSKENAKAVTSSFVELDADDGIMVYDIEFHTANGEYDYEINATTGAITESGFDPVRVVPTAKPTQKPTPKPTVKPTAKPTAKPVGGYDDHDDNDDYDDKYDDVDDYNDQYDDQYDDYDNQYDDVDDQYDDKYDDVDDYNDNDDYDDQYEVDDKHDDNDDYDDQNDGDDDDDDDD